MRRSGFIIALFLTLPPALPAMALRAIDTTDNRIKPVEQPALTLFGMNGPVPDSQPLQDGATLKNPIHLSFSAVGIKIAPAGDLTPGTGHFHLLIDTTLTDDELKKPLPSDAQHIHYGKGQTDATLMLQPGQHTLQLLMGDGNHVPQQPPLMSKVYTVQVQ